MEKTVYGTCRSPPNAVKENEGVVCWTLKGSRGMDIPAEKIAFPPPPPTPCRRWLKLTGINKAPRPPNPHQVSQAPQVAFGGFKAWALTEGGRTGARLLQTELLVRDRGPCCPGGHLVEQALRGGADNSSSAEPWGAGRG